MSRNPEKVFSLLGLVENGKIKRAINFSHIYFIKFTSDKTCLIYTDKNEFTHEIKSIKNFKKELQKICNLSNQSISDRFINVYSKEGDGNFECLINCSSIYMTDDLSDDTFIIKLSNDYRIIAYGSCIELLNMMS